MSLLLFLPAGTLYFPGALLLMGVLFVPMIAAGFVLCVLKWCGKLPEADVGEIWKSIAFAYGVGLGTIDFNICRDNWVESKGENQQ